MNTPINKSIFNETGCIRKEQLLRYRDQKLSSSEQHEVEEHLVDCGLCSEALEGLLLISNTATLDSLQHDVSKMALPPSSYTIRPWLAAATITGVVLFSYFTYHQFKNTSEDRIAEHKTIAPAAEVSPADAAASGNALSTMTATDSQVPAQKTLKDEEVAHKQEKAKVVPQTYSISSEVATAARTNSEPDYPKAEVAETTMQPSSSVSKDIAPFSTALKNSGNQNITYVDNMKVIDYTTYDVESAQQADAPRGGTTSKYQNSKKQEEAAEAEQKTGDNVKRKTDYIDLVADPVILFNNGRYASANVGFDNLLKMNSNDQNAAFYKGLSLYNMKKYDPALDLLVPISNDSASPFMEEAKFYAAQSYISNGSVAKGKIILEEISNSNGFYSDKAKVELKKIK